VSGAGPFTPLAPDPAYKIDAPVVLLDNRDDLDDPFVIALGDLLGLWFTATPRGGGPTTILHSDAYSLEEGFLDPIAAVSADEPWEDGQVSGPSVLMGSPWLLLYNAAGAIGVATSTDGHLWDKIHGTTLTPNGAEEGTALGPPAAVRLGDRVRVYYSASGAIYAADTDAEGLLAGRIPIWTRLDGDPSTPERDPMLTGVSYGLAIERVFARAAPTPAGRLRHDLYFTVRIPASGTQPSTTCGFASSYSGDRFLAADAPILPLTPAARGPAETPYRDGALLLYVGRAGARDAIWAAKSP
jgi:hypothetical protein